MNIWNWKKPKRKDPFWIFLSFIPFIIGGEIAVATSPFIAFFLMGILAIYGDWLSRKIWKTAQKNG